ncbi:MAG: Crp/Fnr family transcriptional regulator [Eubacteriales bacterium]|nr:Crp/Fnr family transcriptional regulator [Eubacteriales bacterium]
MELKEFFPIWNKLSPAQQALLTGSAMRRQMKKGDVIQSGSAQCTGLLLVCSGQLRAHILSEEGREITIYRLFERDLCLFSASCMMRSIQFDISVAVEKDAELWVVPAEVYRKVMEESAPLANYTNEIMATRFSDVMWLIEQVLWKSFDKRLAAFLLEESAIEGTTELKITHEIIGSHMGNPREVVTRMLRYFQTEGMVRLSRGAIELTDIQKLETLSAG